MKGFLAGLCHLPPAQQCLIHQYSSAHVPKAEVTVAAVLQESWWRLLPWQLQQLITVHSRRFGHVGWTWLYSEDEIPVDAYVHVWMCACVDMCSVDVCSVDVCSVDVCSVDVDVCSMDVDVCSVDVCSVDVCSVDVCMCYI